MTNTFLRIQTLHLLALIVLTSLVFSNTQDNAYHLDSIYRVQNNTEIDQFWPPDRFFKDPRTGSTSPQIAEYRPFAAQVARAYTDAGLWRKLSQRGQAHVRSRYSRQAVRGTLEAIVAEMTGGPARRP